MVSRRYDVLNQRYLVKRDPKTGGTRRLLRLAIGSRSQLCDVHAAFKVVVIVEAHRAYEELDLPLLNRFEKQLFAPEHALDAAQARPAPPSRHPHAPPLPSLRRPALSPTSPVPRRASRRTAPP